MHFATEILGMCLIIRCCPRFCCCCCCCCVASVVCNSMRSHRPQPTRLPHPWDSPGKNTGVGCHFLLQRMKVKSESEVAQSCPTLRNPMDCSPPGSSAHGIFQARVLEWGAIAFSPEGMGSIKWSSRESWFCDTGRCFHTPVQDNITSIEKPASERIKKKP